MMTMVFKISGMTCSHCEQTVTSALRAVDGVSDATVSAKAGTATVTFDPVKASVPKLKAAVAAAGYEVTDSALGGSGYRAGVRPACCEPPEKH
ncbi:MAG: heavy-metal-associated domain-containing protein [Chloroflexota bacterium]